ncbi:hypothetical protein CE195_05565, partial [Sodalis-like symbiont of Philaenus spumarius]
RIRRRVSLCLFCYSLSRIYSPKHIVSTDFRAEPFAGSLWLLAWVYASRNLIERFFCRIKQFRCVTTRYDKLSERFASFVALTAAFIWLC